MPMSCFNGWFSRLSLVFAGWLAILPAHAFDGDELVAYFRQDTGRIRPAEMVERYVGVVRELTGLKLEKPVVVMLEVLLVG